MFSGDEVVAGACAEALASDGHEVEIITDLEAVLDRAAALDVLVVVPPIPVVGRSDGGASLDWLASVQAATGAVAPHLMAKGGGRIVVVVVASGLPGRSFADEAGSAMWGAVGLARSAARELAPHGVTVNAVRVGMVDHPGLRAEAEADPEVAAGIAEVARRSPLKRTVVPADVGAAVAYLVSPGAAYVTGIVLPVDGGLTIGIGG